MDLTRTQILKGNFKYPEDLIKLRTSKHFKERLEERGYGIDCIPTMVRVTKNNIHSAKTENGVDLNSVVVRLKYNPRNYIFICFNPYDGMCKTLWFKARGGSNGNKS